MGTFASGARHVLKGVATVAVYSANIVLSIAMPAIAAAVVTVPLIIINEKIRR